MVIRDAIRPMGYDVTVMKGHTHGNAIVTMTILMSLKANVAKTWITIHVTMNDFVS